MDVRQNAVAIGVTRFQFMRFKHEDYVRMYNEWALTNVFNCLIGSELHQHRLIILMKYVLLHTTICCKMYTMNQKKRGLYPYDDKQYLIIDLADGRPNPHIHAYGHRDLAAEKRLVAD